VDSAGGRQLRPREAAAEAGGQFADVVHVIIGNGEVRSIARRADEKIWRAAITIAAARSST